MHKQGGEQKSSHFLLGRLMLSGFRSLRLGTVLACTFVQ
jgi:hypothetical protein